jgi:hypothetical protein
MAVDLNTLEPLLDEVRWTHDGKLKALCPFHEETNPSFYVTASRYRCFGCNASGRTSELRSRLADLPGRVKYPAKRGAKRKRKYKRIYLPTDIEELERLAMDAHLTLVNWEGYYVGYLEKRGVDGRIQPQMIGWWDGWYSIPVFDEIHGFQGVVLRASPGIESDYSKYMMPTNQRPMMYVPDWRLLKREKVIFIVFGMLDALTLCDLRMPVVTTTAGAASFDPVWLDDYRRRVYVIPDKEPSVEREHARELLSGLDWRGEIIDLKFPDGCKDCNDFLWKVRGGRKKLQNQLVRYL